MSKAIQNIIKSAVTGKHHLLLVGQTGSGKTTLVAEYAKAKGKTLHRVSISADTSKDDLLGRQTLIDGNIVWVDGIVTTALRNGDWLVLDEINMAGGDLTATLHSLTDEAASVLLEGNDNEVVKAKASFRLFATMNPPEADYGGTKPLNQAFASRFIVATVDYLPVAEEAKLVATKTGITQSTAENIVELAHNLRVKKSLGEIGYAPSTRDVLQWGKLLAKKVDATEAFALSVANKAMTERETVIRLATEFNTEYQKLVEDLKNSHGVSTRDELLGLSRKLDIQKMEVSQLRSEILREVKKELQEKQDELTAKEREFEAKVSDINSQLKAAYERGVQDAKEHQKQALSEFLGA